MGSRIIHSMEANPTMDLTTGTQLTKEVTPMVTTEVTIRATTEATTQGTTTTLRIIAMTTGWAMACSILTMGRTGMTQPIEGELAVVLG